MENSVTHIPGTHRNLRAKILLIALISLFFQQWSYAQIPDSLFIAANKDYQKADYNGAVEKYTEILDMGYISPELYNNLGNAYYRLGYIAPTILAYERASVLAPSDKEIQHNLSMARRLTSDNIIPLGQSLTVRVVNSVVSLFTASWWAILTAVFTWAMLIFFAIYLYGRSTSMKRWAFYVFAGCLISGAISYGFHLTAKKQLSDNPYAIVTEENINVKSEPSTSGGDVFSLHEGTKVEIEESLNTWHKIRLADGKIGWVPAGSIEKI
ncbi:MAG: SH3 domain-containing protein [Flavobacteriales bacterium]|jgi:batE, TRP domain containing protein|nr:SH3 domain-containing protein [Flavobacteriales bacterium]PWM09793.1 MAG: hypothetical protein DBY00_07375 [Flavobacteriales bacterium]